MSGYNTDASSHNEAFREPPRQLNGTRRPLSTAKPSQLNARVNNVPSNSSGNSLNFDPSFDDIINSTQAGKDVNSPTLPKMRPTAQKSGQWQPFQPEQRLSTSVVKREFLDFDQNSNSSGNDSDSVEFARALSRSSRGTPSRLNQNRSLGTSEVIIDLPNGSYLTTTPPARSKSTRKTDNGERDALRRDAQIRRASSNALNDAKQNDLPSAKSDRRRSTYPHNQTKDSVDEQDTFRKIRAEERHVPAPSSNIRQTRFVSRTQPTAAVDRSAVYSDARLATTPQRTGANPTAQSFMLPDLPNLTELVDGTYMDGTPIFDRNTKPRSQLNPRRAASSNSYAPVDGIELPDDEKNLITSLSLLRDKVSDLERERARSDQRLAEYEHEIVDLRSELEMQRNVRRSDSALGSSDGEGNGKVASRTRFQIEKSRLEATVNSLQQQLETAERKIHISDNNIKRVTKERDSLVTQIGAAFYSSEDLKTDNQALQKENHILREKIDDLEAQIVDLEAQLNQTQDRHDGATQEWTQREAQLKRQSVKDDGLHVENETLRKELANAQAVREEELLQKTRKDNADKAVRAEYVRLKAENDQLLEELRIAKAKREEEIKRWAHQEAQLKLSIEHRDDTIHNLTSRSSHNKVGELQSQNEELKAELAMLAVDSKSNGKKRASIGANLGNGGEKLSSLPKSMQKDSEGVSRTSRRASAPGSTKQAACVESVIDISEDWRPEHAKTRTTVPKTPLSPEKLAQIEADTFLDFGNLDYSGVRREIEAEHASGWKPRVVSEPSPEAPVQQPEEQDITSHSMASMSSKASVHSRVSSIGKLDHSARASSPRLNIIRKDSARVSISRDNSGNTQDTEQSRRSSASVRRKTSAFQTEMTSALLLPDFTLNPSNALNSTLSPSGHAVVGKLVQHNAKNCAVCLRITSNLDSKLEDLKIPVPVPVSILNEQDGDADVTMRPSEAPAKALSRVIKELADEIIHQKLALTKWQQLLNAHDPKRSSRERLHIHKNIEQLNRAIAAKGSQLYSLYDVLEGHKNELTTHVGPVAAKEIEDDLTADVSFDVEKLLAEIRDERRVTIQSPPRAAAVSEDDSDVDDDLPWDGISVTDTETFSRSHGHLI